MAIRTVLSTIIPEDSTSTYTAILRDQDGVAVGAASLTALTLTLYNEATGAIINSRNAQNVLNANNVTVSAGGVLTWSMQEEDNPIIDSGLGIELHTALFAYTWDSGARSSRHEAVFQVQNLGQA